MRKLIPFLSMLLVLAVSPVWAYDLVQVSVGSGAQWCWTDSLDALQADDELRPVDVRLGVGIWKGLAVEAGYRRLFGGGDTFGGVFDTQLVVDAIDIGARYELPVLSWLYGYGRAGLSVTRADLALDYSGGGFDGAAWSAGGFAGAGMGARFPRGWFGGVDDADGGRGFTAGVALELGYAFLGDFDLGRLDGDVDGAPGGGIATTGPGIGSLVLHGLTLQVRLALHY